MLRVFSKHSQITQNLETFEIYNYEKDGNYNLLEILKVKSYRYKKCQVEIHEFTFKLIDIFKPEITSNDIRSIKNWVFYNLINERSWENEQLLFNLFDYFEFENFSCQENMKDFSKMIGFINYHKSFFFQAYFDQFNQFMLEEHNIRLGQKS